MAAYPGLAFLSFLWGSSFLLIKIASRAFDPFDFALARVSVAAAAMLLTSALSGKVWPGSRPALWGKLFALALIGQVVPVLLLGEAATLTTSADMALMMGAQPIFVLLFGRFLGSRDRWTRLDNSDTRQCQPGLQNDGLLARQFLSLQGALRRRRRIGAA